MWIQVLRYRLLLPFQPPEILRVRDKIRVPLIAMDKVDQMPA